MTSRHGIITACSWIVDRIKIINEWPLEEHLAEIIATDQQGGGSAYNLAVDIRKLDNTIPVEAIGLVGADDDGAYLLRKVQEAGINSSQISTIKDIPTPYTEVMSVKTNGRRTFFLNRGSQDHVCPDHFNFKQCKGRILHLGLVGIHAKMDLPWRGDTNGWVTVLKKAQAAGIHTNLELVSIAEQKIREIALPCIPHLNSLIVNDYELGAIADSSVCDSTGQINQQRLMQVTESLFEYNKKYNGSLQLIVVHSPAAAASVTSDGTLHWLESFNIPDAQIVSSVGAGDAFAAGMLYGLHEAWPPDKSLELAHAVAAASLRSATTVGSVDTVQNCLAFARQFT